MAPNIKVIIYVDLADTVFTKVSYTHFFKVDSQKKLIQPVEVKSDWESTLITLVLDDLLWDHPQHDEITTLFKDKRNYRLLQTGVDEGDHSCRRDDEIESAFQQCIADKEDLQLIVKIRDKKMRELGLRTLSSNAAPPPHPLTMS